MKVIDPHVHFWDLEQVPLPWLANPIEAYSGDSRLLPKRYLPADLLGDAGAVELLGSIHVEANSADPVAEVRWAQSLAADPLNKGHPHGIVAYVDLSNSDAPELLEQLSPFPNVRGIRQILNVHADPRYDYVGRHYMTEPLWRENLSRLTRYNWSFDLQIYPSQVPLALEVLDANPSTVFIINHAGMFVDRNRADGWRQWRTGLHALAGRPNCAIKLSGFVMFDHTWTVESVRPYVLEAVDAFGTDRCMFASNFPIDRLHASYSKLWSAYSEIVSGTTIAERNTLFANNASRHYRLKCT